MNLIDTLNQKNMKQRISDFKVGDTVRVHQKIIEGSKERIQVFEGVVINRRAGVNINGTFIVRKISEGVGVERTYLVHSPKITKIEVIRRGKVRRANLSYLRALTGKKAKLKEKQFDSLIVNVVDEPATDKNTDINEPQIDTEGSEEIRASEESVSLSADDGSVDAEVTELSSADEEDEEKLKEISTEKEASIEEMESEEVHETEEENTPEDESNLPEEEIEIGVEKAEEEDTHNQEKSK